MPAFPEELQASNVLWPTLSLQAFFFSPGASSTDNLITAAPVAFLVPKLSLCRVFLFPLLDPESIAFHADAFGLY